MGVNFPLQILFLACSLLQVYVRYSETCVHPTYYFVSAGEGAGALPPTVRVVEPKSAPLISAARTIASVWHQTFTGSGFRVSVDSAPPARYVMRHMAEPSIDQKFRPYWRLMGDYQICSQIPGWSAFGKGHLVKSSRTHGHAWAPFGFVLPNETAEMKEYAKSHMCDGAISADAPECQWFVQKSISGSFGQGIVISDRMKDFNMSKRSIVQLYVDDPALIHGHKFDLRVYYLITSLDPLIVYQYREGYGKLASEQYERPTTANAKNKRIHLTNRDPNIQMFRENCTYPDSVSAFQTLGQTFRSVYEEREQFTDPVLSNASIEFGEFESILHSRLTELIVTMFQDLYEHILEVAEGEVDVVELFNNKTYARHGLDVILRRNGQF